jgi:multiple sugar transport system permease protein
MKALLPRLLGPAGAPYLFLSPFVLLFAVFGLVPLLFSFAMAFMRWDPVEGLGAMHYAGLSNFSFTLGDPWFWKSLGNTLWLSFAAGVPQHVVAIPLAYFIHSTLGKLRNAVVAAYFAPYITSTVAIAIMSMALFSTDYGLVNAGLARLASLPVLGRLFPATGIDWLGSVGGVKPAIAIVVFWRFVGFNTVLYLAALQGISKEIYEASELDGANSLQRFWYVTLPLLKPAMLFGFTLSVIGGLQLFEEPFILTGGHGGPGHAAMTTAMYMYRTAFEFNDFGAASAISWLLFAVVGSLVWVTYRWLRPADAAA